VRKQLYRWSEAAASVIVPGLRYSQYHYFDCLHQWVPDGVDWLDMGCGHQMFASWMMAQERELAKRANHLIGIDLDMEGMRKHNTIRNRVFGTLEQLPFAGDSFSLVTANMVVEHLEEPDRVLAEVRRVLRAGGLFIFHTPNRQCVQMTISRQLPQGAKNVLIELLEGRAEEDVFPTHYRLNTMADIQAGAARHGFQVKSLAAFNSSPVTSMLGPFAAFELTYLRMLEQDRFQGLRSNLITVLLKA
jgi:2-polyprenyl-3-methyl-5-hydroxy-6-metoxy-1,4-benzoquinol methylase